MNTYPNSIRFKLTSSDIIHIGRFYWSSRPLHKLSRVVAIVLIAFAILDILRGTFDSMTTTMVVWAIVLWWFNLIHALTRWLRFKVNPELYIEPYDVVFDDSGVYAKTSTRDSHLQWTAYHRVLESEKMFLLFYAKRAFQSIPKRAFSSEEEIEAFRNLLKQKVGKLH